jgi:hypothetical protein
LPHRRPRDALCAAGVVQSMPSRELMKPTPTAWSDQRDQVLQIASEPIEPPAADDVEPGESCLVAWNACVLPAPTDLAWELIVPGGPQVQPCQRR